MGAKLFKQDGSVATIRCHLDRNEQAAKAFKDTVREGKSALLVEYDGTKRSVSDRLKIRIGNADKEVVRIKVKYSFIAQMEIIDQHERNQSGMNGNELAEDVYDARISNLVYKSDPDRIIYNLTIPLLSNDTEAKLQVKSSPVPSFSSISCLTHSVLIRSMSRSCTRIINSKTKSTFSSLKFNFTSFKMSNSIKVHYLRINGLEEKYYKMEYTSSSYTSLG